jgi:hypothetical protein
LPGMQPNKVTPEILLVRFAKQGRLEVRANGAGRAVDRHARAARMPDSGLSKTREAGAEKLTEIEDGFTAGVRLS